MLEHPNWLSIKMPKFGNINANSAAKAIGPISNGMSVFAFNKGQWSLVDAIKYIASFGSDWDLTVSAWQATGGSMAQLAAIPEIKAARFLIDKSFQNRQPGYAYQMLKRFGDGALLVTKSHAKFCLMRCANLSIVIRSSMNLNSEPRLEMIEVDENAEMHAYFSERVTGAAAQIPKAQGELFYG